MWKVINLFFNSERREDRKRVATLFPCGETFPLEKPVVLVTKNKRRIYLKRGTPVKTIGKPIWHKNHDTFYVPIAIEGSPIQALLHPEYDCFKLEAA